VKKEKKTGPHRRLASGGVQRKKPWKGKSSETQTTRGKGGKVGSKKKKKGKKLTSTWWRPGGHEKQGRQRSEGGKRNP